jgi:tetratricopeptide (TPR) repeat protein
MTERALRLVPDDADAQFTHAMLLVDGGRCGIADKMVELLARLPSFVPSVRINVAVRLAKLDIDEFVAAVDVVLAAELPQRIMSEGGSPMVASYGDIAQELFSELGEAIIERAPDRLHKLVALLPDDVTLLSDLAWKAIQASQREPAIALYDRLLALPIPDEGPQRTNYLRGLNNACVQTHAAKAFETAVRIADRAQPVAHENPYIYHSAACAYAAVGDYAKALGQVRLAFEHNYEHLAKIEGDADLGPLLESPELKTLFRDWRAQKESN